MYAFTRIFRMNLTNLLRNPVWWLGTLELPLFLALIMGFITRSAYGEAVRSYDYYGVTILVFGILNNATVAANSLMETRVLKANMRLCTIPIPTFFIHFSHAAASFVFGVLCHTLTALALHFFAGVNFGGGQAFFLWLLLLAAEWFAAALGIMLCCLMKREEAVNQLLSTLLTLLCLLGGAFFPISSLGPVAHRLGSLSPVLWMNAAAFGAVYGDGLLLAVLAGAGLILLGMLCTAVSTKTFRREDYL